MPAYVHMCLCKKEIPLFGCFSCLPALLLSSASLPGWIFFFHRLQRSFLALFWNTQREKVYFLDSLPITTTIKNICVLCFPLHLQFSPKGIQNLLFTLIHYKYIYVWKYPMNNSTACVMASTHTRANWLCIYVGQK